MTLHPETDRLTPFVCQGCGDRWAADPRLLVACTYCGARAGLGCVRPSDHRGNMVELHAARRKASFEAHPCRCLKNWEAAQAAKPETVAEARAVTKLIERAQKEMVL